MPRVTDNGMAALRSRLRRLDGLRVDVGAVGPKAQQQYPDGATLEDVAKWMELGTPTVTARPFGARTAAALAKDYADERGAIVQAVVDGQEPRQALVPYAKLAVEEMRHQISTASQWAEPLAKSTADAKGHDRPLVDSHRLINGVSYVIRKNDP